jgi:hypothetical protein
MTVFWGRGSTGLAGATSEGGLDLRAPLPFLDPALFNRVLAATLALAVVGSASAFWIQGERAGRDVIGALIRVPIAAYLVHLWLLMRSD